MLLQCNKADDNDPSSYHIYAYILVPQGISLLYSYVSNSKNNIRVQYSKAKLLKKNKFKPQTQLGSS